MDLLIPLVLIAFAPLPLAARGRGLPPASRLLRFAGPARILCWTRLVLMLLLLSQAPRWPWGGRASNQLAVVLLGTLAFLRAAHWRVGRNARYVRESAAYGPEREAVRESRRITLRLWREGLVLAGATIWACLTGSLGIAMGMVPLLFSAYASHTVKALTLGSP